MAVQSSFYIPDGSTRTFPSTKHIATKQHCAVYLQKASDSLWETADVNSYELIQNSIVFDDAVDTVLYLQVEIRVADSDTELSDSPSDIAIVAANITSIVTDATNIANINTNATNIGAINTVSGGIANVNTVATNIADVNTVGTNIANVNATALNIANVNAVGLDLLEPLSEINTVAVDIANVNTVGTAIANVNTVATNIAGLNTIVTNMAEILLADDNADVATTQAGLAATAATQAQLREWEAEADALTALSYATEAEDVLVNIVTSDGDGTFTYTPQAGVYSSKHHQLKAGAYALSVTPSVLLHTLGNGAGNPEGYTSAETDTQISNRMSGFKNGIINPSFEINQYADIDTAPVAMAYQAYKIDRFNDYIQTVTGTIQRQPKSLVNGKHLNSVKCVATSTASGRIGLQQRVELFYNGETKTFGAWVKSNKNTAQLFINDGVSISASSAHSGSGSWEFLSVSKTISASATLLYCYVIISGIGSISDTSITTGDYIESTMWQLEDGTVATKFEQRPIGLELNLCKRYYEKIGISGHSAYYNFAYSIGNDTTNSGAIIKYSKKRVVPTITSSGAFRILGGGSVFAHTVTSIAVSSSDLDTALLTVVHTATTAPSGQYAKFQSNNDVNAYIALSAEL